MYNIINYIESIEELCASPIKPTIFRLCLFLDIHVHVPKLVACVYENIQRAYACECVFLTVVNTCSKTQPRFSSQANLCSISVQTTEHPVQFSIHTCTCMFVLDKSCELVCMRKRKTREYMIVFCTNACRKKQCRFKNNTAMYDTHVHVCVKLCLEGTVDCTCSYLHCVYY